MTSDFRVRHGPDQGPVGAARRADQRGKREVSEVLLDGEPLQPTNALLEQPAPALRLHRQHLPLLHPRGGLQPHQRGRRPTTASAGASSATDDGAGRAAGRHQPDRRRHRARRPGRPARPATAPRTSTTATASSAAGTPRASTARSRSAATASRTSSSSTRPSTASAGPSVYLSLLRLVCSNGAVGYSPAFRSELSVGKGDDGVGVRPDARAGRLQQRRRLRRPAAALRVGDEELGVGQRGEPALQGAGPPAQPRRGRRRRRARWRAATAPAEAPTARRCSRRSTA